MQPYEHLQHTKQYLNSKGFGQADIGIVLGTGLHKMLDFIDVQLSVRYADIPNFPLSTVEFHKGNLIYGTIGNAKCC